MPEYDIDLAESFALVATGIVNGGVRVPAPEKTALYTALLSTELSLKAMLEQAGMPVDDIHDHRHNLQKLLNELGNCKVMAPGRGNLIAASCLRSKVVKNNDAEITVGEIIDKSFSNTNRGRCANSEGNLPASTYPNEIRYGTYLNHFHPEVLAKMAGIVCAFAKAHWQDISRQ
jgi:hypothetical protein